jgi:hypothetical protein
MVLFGHGPATVCPSVAWGQPVGNTIVTQVITVDTTWKQSESPYRVERFVEVQAGVTLTIEEGVEVHFNTGGQLYVRGKLSAIGTAEERILFTGVHKSTGSWQGIIFHGSTQSPSVGELVFTTVEYGGNRNSGNVSVSNGHVRIAHSMLSDSAGNGIFIQATAVADISDTTLSRNSGYAIFFNEFSRDSILRKLSASGNGNNGIGVGGASTVKEAHTWEFTGVPYVIVRSVTIDSAGILTIEPGVEVVFGNNGRLDVRGTLFAVGTVSAPIIFTGAEKVPGSWQGIIFTGTAKNPSRGDLDYATVEYGGVGTNGANLYASNSWLRIRHSLIRHSAGSGVLLWHGASRSVIEASHIVNNRNFGIYTVDSNPAKAVMAANNWWGDPTGPALEGSCGPGGIGNKVSGNVIFRPFLSSPDSDPGLVAPAHAATISFSPGRWFAPADGLTPIDITITLRDGFGMPLPGRRVRLQTSLGTITEGPITDLMGKTFATVRSPHSGEAEIVGQVEVSDRCGVWVRTNTLLVTFTSVDNSNILTSSVEAPYFNSGIEVSPSPVVRGVATMLRARLNNPNPFPIVVDVTFAFAQSGIGLAFGPVGEVRATTISAQSHTIVEVQWTPTVSGHYCIEVQYNYVGLIQPAKEFGTNWTATQGISTLVPVTNGGAGRTQRNVNVYPGPFLDKKQKDAAKKAKVATDAIQDAAFVTKIMDKPPFSSVPMTLIQDQFVGNILDFIYGNGSAISCALGGGAHCEGWKGPRIQLPGGSIGNLLEDPPSQDYRSRIVVEPISLQPITHHPDMPAGLATSLSKFVEASLDLLRHMFATVVSYDRYAGASEANDLEWSSIQAAIYLMHMKKSGETMIEVSDIIHRLMTELRNEGVSDVVISSEAYHEYQEHLAQGYGEAAIAAAHLVGFIDDAIEARRQSRLAKRPEEVAGSVLEKLESLAAAYHLLGDVLLQVPAFGTTARQSIEGSMGEEVLFVGLKESPGAPKMGNHSLIRLFDADVTLDVGNPLSQQASIELRVRPVNLPPDWSVAVVPDSFTLSSGEQRPVAITIQPGTSVAQASQPRIAIEGYIGDRLIGGVVIDVFVPYYVEENSL